MECLEVAIKKDELPFILTGLVYKNGLYFLERLLLTVSVLGFLLTLGEFLVGIFGPDEIWVSIAGPSFTESLLLHPRLFASLGLVLAVGSRSLSVHISNTIHRSSQSYFMNRVSLVFKEWVNALMILKWSISGAAAGLWGRSPWVLELIFHPILNSEKDQSISTNCKCHHDKRYSALGAGRGRTTATD